MAPGGWRAAERVYWLYAALFSLCFWMTSALNVLYMATEVGLSPFQMVVVGSVLEAAVFVFEVPTGILADLVSRRLSVLVGLALIGAGFLVQAAGTTFAAMLAAQVVWGLGYTFTSGADTAWLADEVGEERLAQVLTRAQQLRLGGTVVGIVAAGALGVIDIQVPLAVSGAGFVVLAAALAALMPETTRARGPVVARGALAQMRGTLVEGLAIARRRPVVRAFLVIGLLTGMSSEAVDRLWTVRVVEELQPSSPGQGGTVLLFAAITLAGTLIALGASLAVNAMAPTSLQDAHPRRVLAALVLVEVLAVAGIALAGALWLVLAALWLRTAVIAIAAPVRAAWLNRSLDARTRATSLSLNGQADAIGQVIGGPPLGAVGSGFGVPVALIASAVVLAPAAAVFARLRPECEPAPEPTGG